MSEKLGFLLTMFLFSIFIIPFLLHIYIMNIRTDQFNKVTNEITQLVKENGGYTEEVGEVVSAIVPEASEEGTLTFSAVPSVTGKQPAGETVDMAYTATWTSFYGIEVVLETEGNAKIERR